MKKFRNRISDIGFLLTKISLLLWIIFMLMNDVPKILIYLWISINVVGLILGLLTIGSNKKYRSIITILFTSLTIILISIGHYISSIGGL